MKKKLYIISILLWIFFLVALISIVYLFFSHKIQEAIQSHPAFIQIAEADYQQIPSAPSLYAAETRTLTSTDMPSLTLEDIQSMPAYTALPTDLLDPDMVPDLFYSTAITEDIQQRIMGVSYRENDHIGLSELRYIRVLHWDFDGQIRIGEMIVNQSIAASVLEIMYQLYINDYAIEKMVLIDEYNADDEWSMNDDNTSAFNYRTVANSDILSNHSYGMAIDINPLYNPYVVEVSGTVLISPSSGAAYADRSGDFPHKMDAGDLCVRLFKSYGFAWGGDWASPTDYQHFEKYVAQ